MTPEAWADILVSDLTGAVQERLRGQITAAIREAEDAALERVAQALAALHIGLVLDNYGDTPDQCAEVVRRLKRKMVTT